jgi:uncharacterized damage-inducible protein DinB
LTPPASRGEVRRLAELLRQAYEGEPGRDSGWHGPSLRALLAGVTAEEARRRPLDERHTIWELVVHMAAWDEICVRRLAGEVILATTGSPEDWPAVTATSAEAWEDAVGRLRRAQAALVEAVRGLTDAQLEATVPGWEWSNHLMIHGTVHHDLYHAGQIALLKKP